jgi:hypothetical protein
LYVPRQAAGDTSSHHPSILRSTLAGETIEPFAIDMAAHRLRGPLPLSDALYARDFNEVKQGQRIGRAVAALLPPGD